MADRKLNATKVPLVECLFEVRWGSMDGGKLHDEFELSMGRLYDRLKPDFQFHQRINSLPRELYEVVPPVRNVPFVRFLKSQPATDMPLPYPLLQYGPGIATCNVDKVSYEREAFLGTAMSLHAKLAECHENLEQRIDQLVSRSIDLFEVSEGDFVAYMNKNFTVELASGIDAMPELTGSTKLPAFSCLWKFADYDTTLRVSVSYGQAGGTSGLLTDIVVESTGTTLAKHGGIENLLRFQHKVAGDSFFKLLKEDFLHELRNGN